MLLSLYAFNCEVAQVTWRAKDPLTVAMRFQWWIDSVENAVAGDEVPRHYVSQALAESIRLKALPKEGFFRLIAALQDEFVLCGDGGRDGFAKFIENTAGEVMWLASQILGAPLSAQTTVRDFGWGSGVAGYLRAVSQLKARGRLRFLNSESDQRWAVDEAMARIRRARQNRLTVPSRVLPALLAGWRADTTLRRARNDVASILHCGLCESEFSKRWTLLSRSLTRRW